jgi:hypothetical protein
MESVDIAPEPEAKLLLADTFSSCTIKSRERTANSGAETIHFDAAQVRHISRWATKDSPRRIVQQLATGEPDNAPRR